MRKTNDAGVELIKSFEGLRLKAYRDSVNVLTIGYGHTGPDVRVGQVITEKEAERLLREDLGTAERGVESAITEDITDNQFAACVSLAFNVGVGAFRKSSIVKYINAGDVLLAADRFLLYNKAGGKVLAGLTRRRKAERALFLTDDEPDEPILNGEIEPQQPEIVTTTTTTTETPEVTKVVEEKAVIPAQVKEIAGTGLSTIGNKLATGGISTGVLSAVGAFLEKAWPMLVFAGVLIVLGVAIWMLIYHNQHKEKQMTAAIAADPTRTDIKFK